MAIEIVVEGKRRIAVPVGASAKGTALSRILALKTSPGWLVADGGVREWRFEGMTEQDGSVYLYGPHLSGKTLQEIIPLPLAQALPSLESLTRSLIALSEKGIPRFALQADSVFFVESDGGDKSAEYGGDKSAEYGGDKSAEYGGVLFLPPAIFREIRDLSTFAQTRDTFESLNHPDLKGEALASFSIAASLYRAATGRFPFTGADAEEQHERARKLEVPSPAGLVPELSPELSAAVMAGLGRVRGESVSLAQWADLLAAWQKQELYRTLNPDEKDRLRRETGAREQDGVKSFRRRMFWEKNWKVALVVAVAVIAGGAVLGSILKNVLAPRPTHGFSPRQVVEAFYESMNTLDQMTMQACVIGNAGKGEINETTTLYVTSRVTQGYEGKSNIVSAEEWDKAGRPRLVSPQTLYGVTGLTVTQEQGEPTPVFLAKYDRWEPAPNNSQAADVTTAPRSQGFSVTDRLWMKKDKEDWVIYKIDRLEATPLPPLPPPLNAAPASATTPLPTR